ncbi:MAG: acyl-CoA dehydrogenase family protein, partial [Rhodospirillales bacterium]|nr:acyl-CoA dehydrogenase family protein [Rhodospirillales bacterium]
MEFELNETQQALRDTARAFAAGEWAPHAATWDAGGIFPVEALRAACRLGFGAMYVPESAGGTGLSRLEAAIVFEELAAADPSTTGFLTIHNMVAWMIATYGSPAQRARWLPRIVAGDIFVSYCLTEPGAGSDAAALAARAVSEGNAGYRLTGQKAFISGGGATDLYLVMARTGGAGAGGISCLAVPREAEGLSFGKPEKKLGWNSQPTAIVNFDGVPVPAEDRIGEEGQGFRIAMSALDGGRINIAACSLGGARACLDLALGHVQQRRAFGRPIADFQALQFKLADMATELEAARLMVHRAAAALDARAADATLRSAMAKRYAT